MARARKRRREGWILVVAGASALGLVGAAWSSHGDPDLAGRAALARISGEFAAAVEFEWERLRRGPELIGDEPLTFQAAPPAGGPPPRELKAESENAVADALLSEANRLAQVVQDPAGALDLLLSVLDRSLDPARLASTRLRVIQLAVSLGATDVVHAQWEHVKVELDGSEALGGVSARLLCALAAAPALDLDERVQVHGDLVERWTSGRLALPVATIPPAPLREALRQRLESLVAHAAPDPRLEAYRPRELGQAIQRIVGHPIVPPADGGVAVIPAGSEELVCRSAGVGQIAGVLRPKGTTGGTLKRAVAEAGIAPAGFALRFDGEDADERTVVRESTPLGASPLAFAVVHADPQSIVSAVGERQAALRAALLLLAVGVAAAGISVFRAVRREQHLAELKSSFVASVSHELRTPVASILLMAENLESGRIAEPGQRRRYHGLIRREAERLRHLVDDVLDFSRIERGKGVHLTLGPLEVRAFASELRAELDAQVPGDALTFETRDLPEELHADGDALRRAVLNLVDNAVKHSGRPEVDVLLVGDGAGGLRLRVGDRGRGLPEGKLEGLFEPFERHPGSRQSAGTGLGLAIVREIAEGHGGRAHCEPRREAGLCFEIHIPSPPVEEPT